VYIADLEDEDEDEEDESPRWCLLPTSAVIADEAFGGTALEQP
jgi:hypothetical protein